MNCEQESLIKSPFRFTSNPPEGGSVPPMLWRDPLELFKNFYNESAGPIMPIAILLISLIKYFWRKTCISYS